MLPKWYEGSKTFCLRWCPPSGKRNRWESMRVWMIMGLAKWKDGYIGEWKRFHSVSYRYIVYWILSLLCEGRLLVHCQFCFCHNMIYQLYLSICYVHYMYFVLLGNQARPVLMTSSLLYHYGVSTYRINLMLFFLYCYSNYSCMLYGLLSQLFCIIETYFG